jgi:hypothetical protein
MVKSNNGDDNNEASREASRIKAQIKKINPDTIECRHLTSNILVKAYIKSDMHFEIGQVVLLEFRNNGTYSGYIVVDDLMEEIEADVLEAQHIVSDGMMYTSLILENPKTKQRMHSLIPSNNQLFCNASVVITGDKVKLRINNGNLFNLEY